MSIRNLRSISVVASTGVSLLAVLAIRSRAPHLEPVAPIPNLHFDETEIDLGEIPVSYESREVRFRFENRGGSDLFIKQLVTSCSCVAARIEPDELAPGQHGTILVAIRALEPEEKLAWVTVHANDPRRPRTTLQLRWRSVAPLELDPLSVDFGQVLPGARTSTTVHVVRHELSRFADEGQIEHIESFPRDEVEAILGPDEVIDITLLPGIRTGVRLGHVDVHLTGTSRKNLRLPLRWEVRDIVQASPSRLFVGSGPPDSNHQRNIVVTATDDAELSLESVSLAGDVNSIDVPWTQASPNTAVVHLTCRFPHTAGAWTSELLIVSRRPEEHTLPVPVNGYVQVTSQKSERHD